MTPWYSLQHRLQGKMYIHLTQSFSKLVISFALNKYNLCSRLALFTWGRWIWHYAQYLQHIQIVCEWWNLHVFRYKTKCVYFWVKHESPHNYKWHPHSFIHKEPRTIILCICSPPAAWLRPHSAEHLSGHFRLRWIFMSTSHLLESVRLLVGVVNERQ